MTELKYIKAIQSGDFNGLPISSTSTEVNMTGSWKFFRPTLKPKESPCLKACPLQISIADYLHKFAAGDHLAALEILRQNNPIPAVTGRVCPNFCQSDCNRKNFDEAVLIGDIERALGDIGLSQPHPISTQERTERVAIIGSGPAGLGAAVFLAREGIKVTIFEQAEAPGGLLRYGIPAYRLPRAVLTQEIGNIIKSYKLDLRCNHKIEPADFNKLKKEFDSVIAAPGLSLSTIPNAWQTLHQVKGALDILAAISREQAVPGQSFIVVGGGNAALDAARSLKRLGKDVKIVYRRTIDRMPAYPEEIKEALAEGLMIQERCLIEKPIEVDKSLQLSLHQAKKTDNQIVAGDFIKTISCDYLIAAIGQEGSSEFTDCDPASRAGDYAHGAASVAEALASGRKAAETVLQKIGLGQNAAPNPDKETPHKTTCEFTHLHLNYYPKRAAASPSQLESKARSDNFSEIRSNFSLEELKNEACRCFHCGSCTSCGICWFFCPDVAIAINRDDNQAESQILFDYDHCKGCGQCAEVCPRGVIEMEEDL